MPLKSLPGLYKLVCCSQWKIEFLGSFTLMLHGYSNFCVHTYMYLFLIFPEFWQNWNTQMLWHIMNLSLMRMKNICVLFRYLFTIQLYQFYVHVQHTCRTTLFLFLRFVPIRNTENCVYIYSLLGSSIIVNIYTFNMDDIIIPRRGSSHILIASSSRYYTRIISLLDEESNHTETGMCEYG